MKQKGPQKYFVPELNASIGTEWISYKTYVAYFPEGLERIVVREMKDWKHEGAWKEQEVEND